MSFLRKKCLCRYDVSSMHCTNIMLCLFAKIETKLTWIMDDIGNVVYWLDIVDCRSTWVVGLDHMQNQNNLL